MLTLGWRLVVGAAWVVGVAGPAIGQEMPGAAPVADGGELWAASALLGRTISVTLDHVPLRVALAMIAARGALRLGYSRSEVPMTTTVSLTAEQITVEDALRVVLEGTGLEAVTMPGGRVVIAPRAGPTKRGIETRTRQGSGTIVGQVADVRTGRPLSDVSVSLVGTSLTAQTTLDGAFTVRRVAAGHYSVQFRRLGYVPATRVTDVVADSTLRLSVSLAPSATTLDEVVTTVTGDQRLVEMGNSIAVINADSLVGQAPIANLSDLVNARVPGVQIYSAGGLIGVSPQANARGLNSFTLSNQMLLYIDGVRVDNSWAGHPPFGETGTSSGRFNDISPDDIESIQVVKGPSAATLYGTDAANGVILATTKRGIAGRPHWSVFAEQGLLATSANQYVSPYFAWGHAATAPSTPLACPLASLQAGACVQDSVVHFSPLQNGATTPLSTGTHQDLGVQVSGGSTTRYFLSVDEFSEGGILKLPTADRPLIEQIRGGLGLGPDQVDPNQLVKYSARENITTTLSPTVDASVGASIQQQDARIPTSNLVEFGSALGVGFRDANDGWLGNERPGFFLLARNRESVTHFTGSTDGNWHPTQWLSARIVGGLDYASTYTDQLIRPNQIPFNPAGARVNGKLSTTVYTLNTGLSATFGQSSDVQSRTSGGLQYTRRSLSESDVLASPLPDGGTDVNSAPGAQQAAENTDEEVVAGGYLEHVLSIADRYFVTVAGRIDGGSAFGSQFSTRFYPKFSGSWLLSSEPFFPRLPGSGTLRLRGAYGWSGVQPGITARLTTDGYTPGYITGTSVTTGVTLSALGNPKLQPEIQKELETGADVAFWNGRLHLEGTYYDKRSANALVQTQSATSLGSFSEEINVAAVRNWGYEGTIAIVPISTRILGWTVSANGSIDHNQVLTFGQPNQQPISGYAILTQGYPMFSYFEHRYSFGDLNHDGMIEPNEIAIDSSSSFVGQAYPSGQVALASSIAFLNNSLTFSAQVDRRFGGAIYSNNLFYQCLVGVCREEVDRRAPLAQQARAVALRSFGDFYGFRQDLDFARLRELSVSYLLPRRVAGLIHARDMRATVSGRNLWIWTKYEGGDPETNGSPTNLGSNNFAYNDLGAIAPVHYWLARVTIGY